MQERRTDPSITPDGVRRAWVFVLAIAALVVLLDQLTKSWAVTRLRDDAIHIVGSLQLFLTFNRGVAFGLGEGIAPVLVGIAIVGLVLVLFGRSLQLSRPVIIGVGLVLGGALGNLADRLFRDHDGAVVDFIDLQWWPVFNIADACIVVGAAMLVLWGSRAKGAGTEPETGSADE